MKNFIILSTIAICVSLTAGQLVGEAQKCSREGQKIDVPSILLKDQPCFACFCRNNSVQCGPQHECPPVDCHILKKKDKNDCCDECLGCKFRNKEIAHGESWVDGCTRYQCKEGVLTTSLTKCHTPCASPHPPSNGTCCPTCLGCWLEGERIKEGQTMASKLDPCVKCQCIGGSLRCAKDSCPVLSCPSTEVEHSSGQCCPQCGKPLKPRGHYEIPGGHCFDGSKFVLNGLQSQFDDCTSCACTKGFLTCTRKSCPPLQCPQEYVMKKKGNCCPECERLAHAKACVSQNVLRQHGETWKLNKCSVCTCKDGQTMCQAEICQTKSCAKGHIMDYSDKECCPRCVKEKPGVCITYGDPHYSTFDGHTFNFQGECRYDLAYDCRGRKFSVRVINDARRSSFFSWTRRLSLKVNTGEGKYKVSLGQKLRTKVNRKRVKIPYEDKGLTINRQGYAVEVSSPIGIKLLWDGATYVELQLDSKWRNRTCGLCGNYNNVTEDDRNMKNGKIGLSDEDMAHSWLAGKPQACSRRLRRLQMEKEAKGLGVTRTQRLSCEVPDTEAAHRCSPLMNDTYKMCHSVVNVKPFYESCILDLCECPPSRMCECDSLTAYTRACERSGVRIRNWRAMSHCGGFNCPRGSMYMPCAPDCKATCQNPVPNPDCHMRPCKEGCYCPPHTVLHKGACIQPDKCRKGKKKKNRKSKKF